MVQSRRAGRRFQAGRGGFAAQDRHDGPVTRVGDPDWRTPGETWDLWLDRETGILVRVTGRITPEADFRPLGLLFAGGGLAVTRLVVDPTFNADVFVAGSPAPSTSPANTFAPGASAIPEDWATYASTTDRFTLRYPGRQPAREKDGRVYLFVDDPSVQLSTSIGSRSDGVAAAIGDPARLPAGSLNEIAQAYEDQGQGTFRARSRRALGNQARGRTWRSHGCARHMGRQ